MPLLDIGYRAWKGPLSPSWTRSWVVTGTGISLVWKGTWIRRLLVLLTFPSMIAAVMVGVFEQYLSEPTAQQAISIFEESPQARNMNRMLENSGLDIEEVKSDPQRARHFVWSYLLFYLFRYPQAFGMILLVGLVAPRLISFDMRSRGYLLYLSRPLTAAEYVLGKAGVLFILVFLVATVPALVIYLLGLFLSTNSWAIWDTWDIPLRILVASIILILPTSAIALALSSLTQESRYAGFAWFSIWLLGHVAYQSLWAANAIQAGGRGMGRRGFRGSDYQYMEETARQFMYLSPYELLGYLQKKAFGLLPTDAPIVLPILVVLGITILGYWIAYWRVSRMLKQ